MAQELVYTSVPKGLDPRRTGFCTVAMTHGMSPYMVKQLEGLTAYTPVFMHYDVNSSYNPPSIFHYQISDGKKNYELLARVSDCGLDYTKRSNKIGHFILISSEERAKLSEGPSCLFSDRLFMTEWNGEPQYFPAERTLNCANIASTKAVAWEKATGDAGWASWLAESYLAEPDKPCFVIFDPLRHLNLQALVSESLMLLPQNRRWDVTWNTYLSALSAGLSCNWRFCIGNPDLLRSIGCQNNAKVLDLRQRLGMAGNTALSQSARTGANPYSNVKQSAATIAASAGFAQSEQNDEGKSLNEMIRKRQQEEEAARKAEEASRQVTPLHPSSARNQFRLKTTNNLSSNEDGADIPMPSIRNNDAKWKRLFFMMSGFSLFQFVVIIILLLIYILPKSQQHSMKNAEEVNQQTKPSQSVSKSGKEKTTDNNDKQKEQGQEQDKKASTNLESADNNQQVEQGKDAPQNEKEGTKNENGSNGTQNGEIEQGTGNETQDTSKQGNQEPEKRKDAPQKEKEGTKDENGSNGTQNGEIEQGTGNEAQDTSKQGNQEPEKRKDDDNAEETEDEQKKPTNSFYNNILKNAGSTIKLSNNLTKNSPNEGKNDIRDKKEEKKAKETDTIKEQPKDKKPSKQGDQNSKEDKKSAQESAQESEAKFLKGLIKRTD